MEPIRLAPFVSIRNLLTLVICGANALILVAVQLTQSTSLRNASDITNAFFLLSGFWLIANEFSWYLAEDLKRACQSMFNGSETETRSGTRYFQLSKVEPSTRLHEITQVFGAYNSLVDRANEMTIVAQEGNKNAALAEIATQVSHDIRSPLSALNLVSASSRDLPDDVRDLIRKATRRITEIANELLEHKKVIERGTIEPRSIPAPISTLLESLVSEKRAQYASKEGISIELEPEATLLFAQIESTNVERALSNLIDNAVEAIDGSGRVTIGAKLANCEVEIRITDNGKGIPEFVLEKLGQRGVTYGKESGNGLGVSFAKKVFESRGGRLEFVSRVGFGSCAIIRIPTTSPLRSSAPIASRTSGSRSRITSIRRLSAKFIGKMMRNP